MPLHPRKRTLELNRGMPALCQKQTLAALFDQLVGTAEQRCRHIDADSLCGLEVDHQFELDRGLDGKLARLCAPEDPIGIGNRASKIIVQVNAVGDEATEFSEEAEWVDGWQTIASSQRYNLHAMGDHDIFIQ